MSTTLTPNLMTEDVNASVIFYGDRLGFRFLAGMPADSETPVEELPADLPLQWAMLERDEAKLMFQQRRSLAAESSRFGDMDVGASAAFYMETADLDGLLAGLGEAVEIVLPERVTFYGMREVWILDNNGYVLTLAQKAA